MTLLTVKEMIQQNSFLAMMTIKYYSTFVFTISMSVIIRTFSSSHDVGELAPIRACFDASYADLFYVHLYLN